MSNQARSKQLEPVLSEELLQLLLSVAGKRLLTLEPADRAVYDLVRSNSNFQDTAKVLAMVSDVDFIKGTVIASFLLGWVSQQMLREFLDSQITMN